MMSTELSGAIVRLRTKDEYDGIFGKICGVTDEGDMVAVKHRPITFPHRRDTILHYFKMDEFEILRS
jgi:hypothetical protein